MAKVFQKCKDAAPPCESVRCGHPWTVRYREPGGRTGRQREKSYPRKKEADAFAAKVENAKNEGIYLDPGRGAITIAAWSHQWIDSRVTIGDGTRQNYQGFFDKWMIPNVGRRTVSGLATSDIQQLVNKMHKAGLAASTIQDRMVPMRSMMKAAISDRRRSDNPCDGVVLPRTPAVAINPDEIPTLDQVNAIAANIDDQYKLTVWLMSGTGLRISEALAFSTDEHRGDFLRVSRQVSSKAHRADCTTRLVPLKHRTDGEYRDVPLAPFIGDEIDAHLDRWDTRTVEGVETLFALRERGDETMPTATAYRHHWHKALKKAGLLTTDDKPRYTPHGLRHFFASTALAKGVPLLEVSRWLGHKSIKVTADIYGHLTPDATERCRTVMQAALRPPLTVVKAA